VSVKSRFTNRELSWLAFNRRVLSLAEDQNVPLIERAKYLAIHSSNLDEFFQVRVAGLKAQRAAGITKPTSDGLTPTQQLALIHREVTQQYNLASSLFKDDISLQLSSEGIHLSRVADTEGEDRAWLDQMFQTAVYPVLTPLAVDPAHPFPYISDLSLNLAVSVASPDWPARFARVKVPPLLPRFLMLPRSNRFVALEDLISENLDQLFKGMDIVSHSPFRVTRNADIDIDDDESDDLMAMVEAQLAQRRFGETVRLEASSNLSEEATALLGRELGVDNRDVYVIDGPLDLSGLLILDDMDRADLKYPRHSPRRPKRLDLARRAGRTIFQTLREGDLLVHHPYESFSDSVEQFMHQAAQDPDVLAIKMTMYRTSERTRIVQSLIVAAEAGKQVVVVVEIKARFDEESNIEWARVLEQSGVHVTYGVVGLKTHAKMALVVRREGALIGLYSHIGTGNYNADTGRAYEDLGLFTADQDIGTDIGELFNNMTGYSGLTECRKLVVAPSGVRRALIAAINSEAAHPDGQILMKMNSLGDEAVIDALYAASDAGCRVELIIRGVCRLRPGRPGVKDNIEVHSIVGQFLEHSRVYRFGSSRRGYTYFMGSPDAMPRNLDGRVEALVPVEDPALQQQLGSILERYLDPDTQAWSLDADGNWTRRRGQDIHQALIAASEEE
jgi:polyphosphate kinase